MKTRLLFIKALLISAYILVVLCGSLRAQTPMAKNVDNLLDSLLKTLDYQFNGSILLAENGEILYNKAIGYSNFKTKDPLNENSVYDLASISKQFTAMAIMILKEQGKLDFDDDVQKYLDGFPFPGVKVRNLLNHTSGMPDYLVRHMIFGSSKTLHNKDVLEFVNRKLKKGEEKLKFKPGEKWEYSNTGYALLVLIVEKVSGEKFSVFMKKNVFNSLGMSHSYVRDESFKTIKNLALSYKYKNPKRHRPAKEYSWNMVVGDGGMYSTVGDLLKWDQALYTEKLVSKKTIEEAFTPAKLNDGSETIYGFGWMINKNPKGERIITHTGSWLRYRTLIIRNVDINKTAILLSSSSIDKYARALFSGMRKILND